MGTNLGQKIDFGGSSLDKLGQLDHPPPSNGVDNLRKRARSKWFTRKIVGSMLYLDSPMHKYYERTFYCGQIIRQQGNILTSTYCDSRLCNVCNRIRTAKMMNGYINQLSDLGNLEFVTITAGKTVDKDCLLQRIEEMNNAIVNIIRSFRRKGIKISGIRKLEITYNSFTDKFHPHFHILVNGHGEAIVNKWLERFKTASIDAQDVRPADKGSLNELFKYTTKILARKESEFTVYLSALDTIITTLKGKRCFQPFGCIRKVDERVDENLEAVEYKDIPEYESIQEWHWRECDWQNVVTKETLTGYISPDVEFIFVK